MRERLICGARAYFIVLLCVFPQTKYMGPVPLGVHSQENRLCRQIVDPGRRIGRHGGVARVPRGLHMPEQSGDVVDVPACMGSVGLLGSMPS